jgi:hypothetical protein
VPEFGPLQVAPHNSYHIEGNANGEYSIAGLSFETPDANEYWARNNAWLGAPHVSNEANPPMHNRAVPQNTVGYGSFAREADLPSHAASDRPEASGPLCGGSPFNIDPALHNPCPLLPEYSSRNTLSRQGPMMGSFGQHSGYQNALGRVFNGQMQPRFGETAFSDRELPVQPINSPYSANRHEHMRFNTRPQPRGGRPEGRPDNPPMEPSLIACSAEHNSTDGPDGQMQAPFNSTAQQGRQFVHLFADADAFLVAREARRNSARVISDYPANDAIQQQAWIVRIVDAMKNTDDVVDNPKVVEGFGRTAYPEAVIQEAAWALLVCVSN